MTGHDRTTGVARRWWHRLGGRVGTLSGRYLLLTGVLALTCLGVALWATVQMTQAGRRAADHISDRHAAAQRLRVLRTSTTRLDSDLRAFLLAPAAGAEETLRRLHRQAGARLEELAVHAWITAHPEASRSLQEVRRLWRELGVVLQRLLRLRANTVALYPASTIFRDEMTPANRAFYAAASRAIEDARGFRARRSDGPPVERTFVDVRQAWSLMIGAFRNLVANRSGIFDQPRRGMRGQQANIALYRTALTADLARLRDWQARGLLSLVEEDALAEMDQMQKQWFRGYRRAMAILSSDRWRTDLPLFQEAFLPRMRALRRALGGVDEVLDEAAYQEVAQLAGTGERLIWIIWVVVAAGVGTLLIGYVMFHRGLLRPVAEVAAALKGATRGRSALDAAPGLTREARRLVRAFEDMEARVHARQAELNYLAYHDPLTALPNRQLLLDRLRHALDQVQRGRGRLAVLFIDLNDFKLVNDRQGHQAGDAVLRTMARRLTACVRKGDTVGRMGGDEFVVILEGVTDQQAVVAVAQKISRALSAPCRVDGHCITSGASIGISLYPEDGHEAERLLQRADLAMYRSKESGADYWLAADLMGGGADGARGS